MPNVARPQLLIDDLCVAYRLARAPVVEGLSLALNEGEIGCVVGSSACGKTTLLRAIAGFIPVTSGSIEIGGVVVSGHNFTAAPEKRSVGLVFQDYALFPHLKVEDNVAFGLRHLGADQRRARVGEMLDLVGLAQQAAKFPHELSGGQQQRVALARALVLQPRLLLMDEPLSSLDFELNLQLRHELLRLQGELGFTLIYVTHNLEEAFAIATRVVVMKAGRIDRIGAVAPIRSHFAELLRRIAAMAPEQTVPGAFLLGRPACPP
jgi:iron(III) transport system ATP-binding protein